MSGRDIDPKGLDRRTFCVAAARTAALAALTATAGTALMRGGTSCEAPPENEPNASIPSRCRACGARQGCAFLARSRRNSRHPGRQNEAS